MLTRIARFVVLRRRPVLVVAAIVFAVAGAFGGTVAGHLTSGGFDDPSSESFKAYEALLDTFGTSTPNVVLLVTADSGDVDDPPTAAAGTALTERLAAEEHVVDVASYWSLGSAPPLRSIGEIGSDSCRERVCQYV